MARKKNALTEYFVGKYEDENSTADLPLAKYISSVTDDSEEETEEYAYYDGDGTKETEVIGIKKAYTFEGTFDVENPAQKLIADMELEDGEARKIIFKQVRTDGTEFTGRATVSDIKVTGGEASEFAPFNCRISWDTKPTITVSPVIP
ncbi:phage tail tube protein [Lysinibacillus sp. NPDC047702]|uniref:phage tail tube protein n=1 Tax=unclassified Lysinibacillus TaxID=2636778 RepID=UPI003D048B80